MSNPAEKLHLSLDRARKARAGAIDGAREAIASMLEALQAVLEGDRLYGMPNLGSSAQPLYAAVVRAKAGAHTRVPLNFNPKKPNLVLTDRGELAMATLLPMGGSEASREWVLSPAEDQIIGGDDEKLANTIAECIAVHCKKTARTSKRLERMAKFSKRLWEVCEYEE